MAGPCWLLLQIRTLGKRAESQDFGRKLNSAGPEACVGGGGVERLGVALFVLGCFGLSCMARPPVLPSSMRFNMLVLVRDLIQCRLQHVVKEPQTKYEWCEHKTLNRIKRTLETVLWSCVGCYSIAQGICIYA